MVDNKNIIIGISGASGAIYGIRLLEVLKTIQGINTHLIISKSAGLTIKSEVNYSISDIQVLADYNYPIGDVGACISSGSFKTDGMIIAPCSIKTMSEIAAGTTTSLMSRAADVILKEKRKLVLMVRETPLHSGHLNNMAKLSDMGAYIYPPVPAFYSKPQTIDDMVNHTIGRVLDIFDIEASLVKRWAGIS